MMSSATTPDSKALFQAVLFDLDGTLLDTAPDFLTATNQLLAKRALPLLAEDSIRQLVSHGSAGIIRNVFDISETHQDFESTRQELLSFYRDCLADKTHPFLGISELLLTLKRHDIPWGIVTNKPELYTLAILDQLPFSTTPKTIICPDHVSKTKPDPESIILACNQLGVEPKNTVYIGDHLRDIEAGLSAGTTTIAAGYGYIGKDEDPLTWGAHHIVNCATELQNLILRP
ncbi:MAG: HAD-IA family hydrolase [Porticoccus sp.]|nr:HAD-IA family hydrolase [Porticoccus sp.]